MPLLLRGWQAELADVEAYQERRRKAQSQIASMPNPRAVAKRVSEFRRAFPNLAPGVLYPYATQAGGVNDATLKRLSEMDLKARGAKGDFTNPGETSDGVFQSKAAAQAAEDRLQQKYPGLATQSLAGVNTAGSGAPQSAFDEYRAAQAKLSTGGGIISDALDYVGGPISAGKALIEGKSPMEIATSAIPGYNAFQSAGQAGMTAAGDLPGVGGPLKGISRAAMLAVDTPMSLINASIRKAASRIDQIVHGGPVFSPEAPGQQLEDVAKQTQGGQALSAALDGRNIDVGSGFFPDSASATGQAAAAQARAQSPFLIGGHAFTPGRYIANTFLDPDTDAFNFVSGAVDAAVTMKGDPFNVAAGAYTEARAAKNVAVPSVVGEQAAANFAESGATASAAYGGPAEGGAFDGLRKWVEPNTATNYFSTGKGSRLVDYHVANGGPELVAARDAQQAAQDEIARLVTTGASDSEIERARNAFNAATQTHTERLGAAVRDSWLRYNKQGPIDMHADLAYAQTSDEVHDVLDQNLGTTLREFPSPKKFRPNWKPDLSEQRWTQLMPDWHAGITPADTERSVANADLWMRGANFPKAAQEEVIGRLALADTPADYSDVMTRIDRLHTEHLAERYGLPPEYARQMRQFFPGSENREYRLFATDADTGLSLDQPLAMIGEHGEVMPAPMLGSEMLNSTMPFPDARATRRLASDIGAFKERTLGLADQLRGERDDLLGRANAARSEGNVEGSESLSDAAKAKSRSIAWAEAKAVPVKAADAMETGLDRFVKLWKKTHLARPALGLRINADAQAQIWAHGLTGLFNDPVHALGIIVGANPESRLGRMLARVAESDAPLVSRVAQKFGVLGADAKGVPFAFDEDGQFSEALQGSMGKVLESDVPKGAGIAVRTPVAKGFTSIGQDSPRWSASVADEVLRLRNDPVAREIARAESPEAAKRWINGEGAATFEDWVAHPNRMARSAPDQAPKLIGEMTNAERQSMADWYTDVVYSRLHGISGGDERILDAIRTGNLDGQTIGITGKAYEQTVKKIDEITNAGWNGPTRVRAPIQVGAGIKAGRTQYLNTMIYNLAGRPTAYLSSSPVFKQLYYKRLIEEMGAALSPEAKAALVHNVEDGSVKLTRDLESTLRRLPTTEGGLALDEADQLAKNYALHGYGEILHDLGKRRQFWDQLRLLAPFGDAYQLVLTRWAKALRDNPMVLRRLGQGIQQGRASGFFTKDSFGQEVFKYPGSDWLTDKLIGVPIPITGSLQGINIAGEGLPGVGPAVSLPAAYLLPNKPSWDGVRNLIFPYGEQSGQTPVDKIIGALEPTWAGHALTFWQTPDGSREFASTVGYLMNQLASSGDYKLHGPNAEDEANRLLKDATTAAKKFALVRGAFSFTAPSAPIPRWLFNDKHNNLAEQQIVRDQYYKRVEDPKVGPDKAFAWLIDTYGDKNFLLAQGFSQSNGIIPRTKTQWDWVRDHAWSQERYPESYGLLAPVDAKGSFDIDSYVAQEDAGKVGLPLEPGLGMTKAGRIALANNRLGNLRYDREAAKIALDDPDRAAKLAAVTAQIKQDLPGYGVQDLAIHTTERRVAELQAAATDPRLAKSNPGVYAALREYLARRAQVQQVSKEQFGKPDYWMRAKAGKDLRDWLRAKAAEIMKAHPEFVAAFDRVFANEMADDTIVSTSSSSALKP